MKALVGRMTIPYLGGLNPQQATYENVTEEIEIEDDWTAKTLDAVLRQGDLYDPIKRTYSTRYLIRLIDAP